LIISRTIPWDSLAGSATIDFTALSLSGASCPVQPEPLLPMIPFEPGEGYRNVSAKLLSEAVVSGQCRRDQRRVSILTGNVDNVVSKSLPNPLMITVCRPRIRDGHRSLTSRSGWLTVFRSCECDHHVEHAVLMGLTP
jgi:hypothetical protein